jgi:SAM-dependent methyltransferase
VNAAGYTLDNAAEFGWGPEEPPEPFKAELLRRECRGKSVLDVGCGTGTYVDFLARLNFEVVGVDPTPAFIEEAERRRAGTFVEGSAERLPFPDKSFDTVLLLSVLEHVDDDAALAEAARVTRLRVIAQVPLADPPELKRNGFVFVHHSDRTHLREYSVSQLTDLFKRHGLKPIRVQQAYPANPRGLLADSIRLPRALRFMTRAALRVFKFAFRPHYAEAFIVAGAG